MTTSHKYRPVNFRPVVFLFLILVIACFSLRVNAQAEAQGRDEGIKLYRQGKIHEAIKVLKEVVKENPLDADAWYFLGLAYYSDGGFGPSGEAFSHSLALRPDSADANAKISYCLILSNETEQATKRAHRAIELGDLSPEPHYALAEASLRREEYQTAIAEAEQALAINPDFSSALITKGLAYSLLKQYGDAAAAFDQFLAHNPNDYDADLWREQSAYYHHLADRPAAPKTLPLDSHTDAGVFSGRQVTTKARVLEKNEPTYTQAARKAGVTGTVILKCVFSRSGEVTGLVVIRALGFGLTTRSVQVARKIRFVPATKDGQPVSMWMELQYNYNLY